MMMPTIGSVLNRVSLCRARAHSLFRQGRLDYERLEQIKLRLWRVEQRAMQAPFPILQKPFYVSSATNGY